MYKVSKIDQSGRGRKIGEFDSLRGLIEFLDVCAQHNRYAEIQVKRGKKLVALLANPGGELAVFEWELNCRPPESLV